MNRHRLIKSFVDSVERLVPLSYADRTWDNVGLLLESPIVPLASNGKCRVLLTIDLTDKVFEEAIGEGVGIILAYHPPWFHPEKSLTLDRGGGRFGMVALCASRNISIYSPHSALDSINGGMNDHIAHVLAKGNLENIESCTPIKPMTSDENAGIGRIVTLKEHCSLKTLIQVWKDYVGIPHLRIALPPNKTIDTPIKTIAICVGSGASVLRKVEADLYFTGEMSHNDILTATLDNTCVILTEHTNCERGYLRNVLLNNLQDQLPKDEFEFIVSNQDHDPITII